MKGPKVPRGYRIVKRGSIHKGDLVWLDIDTEFPTANGKPYFMPSKWASADDWSGDEIGNNKVARKVHRAGAGKKGR